MKRTKKEQPKFKKDKYIYYMPSRNLAFKSKARLFFELGITQSQFVVLVQEGVIQYLRLKV
jgi:hypothetical protein